MYGNHQGTAGYQRTRIITADRGKLVLLCYEGAITNLKMAKDHFRAKEFEAKGKAVQKSIDILHELIQCLDFQNGGEIAKNLNALYLYIIRRITEGEIHKDTKAFDDAIGILEEMMGAWRVVCNGAGKTADPPLQVTVAPEESGRGKAAVNAWRA
jgi:flagellar protein FliS